MNNIKKFLEVSVRVGMGNLDLQERIKNISANAKKQQEIRK